MDRKTYETKMQKAEARILIGDRLHYWQGYQKGLQRQYHGETVVSTQEHIKWLTYLDDPATRERGQGYWDGLIA